MSHGKLRIDKTCQNCGNIVEDRFCSHCGQENTETRQAFHYLFTHFIEDFTHYDGQFWGTIKNLLFKPGKLTNIYLEGKRQKFVPPVKLYIFVSFITFFMFALFPLFNLDFKEKKNDVKEKSFFQTIESIEAQKILDSLKHKKSISAQDSLALKNLNALTPDLENIKNMRAALDMNKKLDKSTSYRKHETKESYDSAFAKKPPVFYFIDKPVAHKFFELKEKGVTKGEIIKNLSETSFHNLPKALFIYLPIFAFFLWVFHHKKKWWYFDHGIFTLHYFSFLLLNTMFISLIIKLSSVINISIIDILLDLIIAALIIYSIIYFFIAHRRTYHTGGIANIFIGGILFTVNFFAFTFLVVGLAIVSFLMMH